MPASLGAAAERGRGPDVHRRSQHLAAIVAAQSGRAAPRRRSGYDGFPYVATVVPEEGGEMVGVALMLRAVLGHVAASGYALRLAAA